MVLRLQPHLYKRRSKDQMWSKIYRTFCVTLQNLVLWSKCIYGLDSWLLDHCILTFQISTWHERDLGYFAHSFLRLSYGSNFIYQSILKIEYLVRRFFKIKSVASHACLLDHCILTFSLTTFGPSISQFACHF